MLSKNDITEIERIVGEKIDEKTKPLPTKEEYFRRMDDLSGQMKKLQETMDLHDGQHQEIDEWKETTDKRVKTIEKKLNLPHPVSFRHSFFKEQKKTKTGISAGSYILNLTS